MSDIDVSGPPELPSDRTPYSYTTNQINRVDRTLDAIVRDVGNTRYYDPATRSTLLPPNTSIYGFQNSIDPRFYGGRARNRNQSADVVMRETVEEPEDTEIFPSMMDNELKMKLSNHSLVETLTLLITPYILSKTSFDVFDRFADYMQTYGLFSLGETKDGVYAFSLDPYYKDKLDEKRKNDANRHRKRELRKLIDNPINGRKKKKKSDTLNGENPELEGDFFMESMRREEESQLRGDRRQNMRIEYGQESDSETDSDSSKKTNEDAPSTWADVPDEEIQAFVDDRLQLLVHTDNKIPVTIKWYQFILCQPIKI